NEAAKDLWDTLERQMRGSEYGEHDRKATILYEYETFKAIEGEQLLDTYLRYLQVINDLKKCGYMKDNYELNYKFLNNLQPEWKQYGDVNDALGYKKKVVVVTSDPLALVVEKTKVNKQKEKVVVSSDSEGSDCKKAKVKDYNYYKTKMLLAKKDSDEQVFLLRTMFRWSPVEILIRKSMQIWSSWLKLKRLFQNQTKVLHLLKKPLLSGGCSHFQKNGDPTARSLHCYDEETASQREMAVTLRRWHTSCP
nr:hypothetical protein [Tanacetum cinerariifolium]